MVIQEEIKAKKDQINALRKELKMLEEQAKVTQGARYRFTENGVTVSIYAKRNYSNDKRMWMPVAIGKTKKELTKEITDIIKNLNGLLDLIESDENIPRSNIFKDSRPKSNIQQVVQQSSSEPSVVTMMREMANDCEV